MELDCRNVCLSHQYYGTGWLLLVMLFSEIRTRLLKIFKGHSCEQLDVGTIFFQGITLSHCAEGNMPLLMNCRLVLVTEQNVNIKGIFLSLAVTLDSSASLFFEWMHTSFCMVIWTENFRRQNQRVWYFCK